MFTILFANSIIFYMNVLLILGLVFFICALSWIYILFISTSLNEEKKEEEKKEVVREDAIEKCTRLYEEGQHYELQKYAQRELSKNYSNVELRRILAKSFYESGNEQSAIMHYEAILNIVGVEYEIQELLAKYYCEK